MQSIYFVNTIPIAIKSTLFVSLTFANLQAPRSYKEQQNEIVLTRKSTLALENMPSFSDTIMNCDLEKCVQIICAMFCVWDRSRAASISSSTYMGT